VPPHPKDFDYHVTVNPGNTRDLTRAYLKNMTSSVEPDIEAQLANMPELLSQWKQKPFTVIEITSGIEFKFRIDLLESGTNRTVFLDESTTAEIDYIGTVP